MTEIGNLKEALVFREKRSWTLETDLGYFLKVKTRIPYPWCSTETQIRRLVPESPIQPWLRHSSLLFLLYWHSSYWKRCQSFPSILIFTMLFLPSALWRNRFDLTTCWIKTQHTNHNTIFCEDRFNTQYNKFQYEIFCITSPVPCS
jgi:hypothetical protein